MRAEGIIVQQHGLMKEFFYDKLVKLLTDDEFTAVVKPCLELREANRAFYSKLASTFLGSLKELKKKIEKLKETNPKFKDFLGKAAKEIKKRKGNHGLTTMSSFVTIYPAQSETYRQLNKTLEDCHPKKKDLEEVIAFFEGVKGSVKKV